MNMNTLLTLIGISALIVLHELGHYSIARWTGMKVLRFSVGFGPVLWSKKWGDTTWQWALIPLGGFVHIHGVDDAVVENTEGSSPDTFSYASKKRWQRACVLAAGPLANWCVSALIIVGISASVGFGVPDLTRAKMGDVLPRSPASLGGVQALDVVTQVAETPVHSWSEMVAALQPHASQKTPVTVLRNGVAVQLNITPDKQGKIGVLPYSPRVRLNPVQAVAQGIKGASALTAQYGGLLWGLITGAQEGSLSGLPGVIKSVSSQASLGWVRFLESLAWLSIGLALLNLMPIPALDGGRLVFLGIETLTGKPVPAKLENVLHTVGFIALMGLMVFASIRDLL
jgi:regulator of sigma E protease